MILLMTFHLQCLAFYPIIGHSVIRVCAISGRVASARKQKQARVNAVTRRNNLLPHELSDQYEYFPPKIWLYFIGTCCEKLLIYRAGRKPGQCCYQQKCNFATVSDQHECVPPKIRLYFSRTCSKILSIYGARKKGGVMTHEAAKRTLFVKKALALLGLLHRNLNVPVSLSSIKSAQCSHIEIQRLSNG